MALQRNALRWGTFGLLGLGGGCIVLFVSPTVGWLRGVNMAAANLALCSLAVATLWPSFLTLTPGRSARLRRFMKRATFAAFSAAYFCAFGHYFVSFVLLSDPAYLEFARSHPTGVIVGTMTSLGAAVLSLVSMRGADRSGRSFAIRINGVILSGFVLHLLFVNKTLWSTPWVHLDRENTVASASAVLGCLCLLVYVAAAIRRARRRVQATTSRRGTG